MSDYRDLAVVDIEYTYRVTEIVKVTDGDTYWLKLDVGFRQEQFVCIRLNGVDCPERHRGSEFEKSEALRATQMSEAWLTGALKEGKVWVKTYKDPDNFGRWLGDVWNESPAGGDSLASFLMAAGLASTWPTRWHERFDKP